METTNLMWNSTIEVVVEETKVLKLCQRSNLQRNQVVEKVVAQIQETEPREVANGGWY